MKINLMLIALLCIQGIIAQDYDKEILNKSLEKLNTAPLSTRKLKQFKSLTEKVNLELKKPKSDSIKLIRGFRKNLSEIITVDDFYNTFPSVVKNYSTKTLAPRRIKFLSNRYKLNGAQQEKVKTKIINDHYKESLYALYYGFNYKQAQSFIDQEKKINLPSINKYIQKTILQKKTTNIALDKYGADIIANVVANAKKFNLNEKKINELIKLKDKYQIDSITPKELKAFRKELTGTLSMDEFYQIFPVLVEDYSNNKLADRRVIFLSNRYQFTDIQKNELKQKIVKEHYKESVLALYHGYDFGVAQPLINEKKKVNLPSIHQFIQRTYLGQKPQKLDEYGAYIFENILSNTSIIGLENKKLDAIKKLKGTYEQKSNLTPSELREFRKELSELITLDEFERSFSEVISKYTKEKIAPQRIKFLAGVAGITESQFPILEEKITKEHTNEGAIMLFYGFNNAFAQQQRGTVKQGNLSSLRRFINSGLKDQNSKEEKSKKETLLLAKAKEVGVSEYKIREIISIYNVYDEKIAEAAKQSQVSQQNALISFGNPQKSKNQLIQNMKAEIKSTLTFDEFGKLFYDQFESVIRNEQEVQFKIRTKGLLLNSDQRIRLKEITDYHAQKLALAKEYYTNSNGRWQKIQDIKLASDKHFEDALIGMNVKSIKSEDDSKLRSFLLKAKEAGVSSKNINELKKAIEQRDQKIKDFKLQQKTNNATNAVNFYDPNGNIGGINKAFRKRLASLVTLSQFKSIFREQLSDRVKQEAEDALGQLTSAYLLNREQRQEMKKLIYDHAFAEVMTKEYYNYDFSLSKQKLRALQYKFDKIYKAKIEELTSN